MPGHSDLGMYPAKKEDIDASNTVELDTCMLQTHTPVQPNDTQSTPKGPSSTCRSLMSLRHTPDSWTLFRLEVESINGV